MGRTIDENVAVLRFDNKSFETNVQTSLGTLDKLKQALKFDKIETAFSRIESESGKVSFTKLSENVQNIESRFSTFGIVGMTVIQDITRGLEGLVTGAVQSAGRAVGTVFNKIYEGGKNRALNIQQARFLLSGLISDGAEVEQIMAQAKESVADTAYGLDEAALAASNLVASGVEAGESLEKALSAIAGVSATTNSDYSRIAEIFSQISGYGKVMSNDFLQLSSRGLNGAAILADYFNKVADGSAKASDEVKKVVDSVANGVKVTEADIRDLTRKGEISFEMFSSAMSEKFGAHAKDANKTLTGVLSNVNARFSQIGAKFIEPLVEQEGPLVSFFNKVKDKLAEVRDEVDIFAELFDNTVIKALDVVGNYIDKINVKGFFDKVHSFLIPSIGKDAIEEIGLSEEALKSFKSALKEVAKEHNVDIETMRKSANSFWDTLDEGWLSSGMLTEAINKLTGAEKEVTGQTDETVEKLKELVKLTLGGEYGTGENRFAALKELGADPQQIQDVIDKVYELTGGTWSCDEATIQAAIDALGLNKTLGKTSEISKKDKKALEDLANATEKTKSPFDQLMHVVEDLHKILESFLGILSKIGDAAGSGFNDVFGELIPDMDMDTARNEFINKFDFITNALSSITIDESKIDQIRRIFRGIFSVASVVLEVVSTIFGKILPAFYEDGKNGAESLIETVAIIADKIYEFSQNFEVSEKTIDKIISVLKGVLAVGSIVFGALSTIIKNVFGPFTKVLAFVFAFILDKMAFLGNALVNIDQELKNSEFFKDTISKITDFFSTLKFPKSITDFFEGIADVSDLSKTIDFSGPKKLLDTVLNVVENFIESFLNIDYVAMAVIAFFLYRTIKSFIGLFGSVASIPAYFAGAIKNLSGAIRSVGFMFSQVAKLAKKLGYAAIIISVAYAFAKIAEGVSELSKIPQEGLKQAVVLTVLITGVIIGIYASIGAIDKKAKMAPSISTILFVLVVAKAFIDIGRALAKLKDLSYGQIIVGLVSLFAAIGIMAIIAKKMSEFKTRLSLSALLFPILYAKGLKDIAKALTKIKDMNNDQIIRGLVGLLGSLVIMAAIAVKLSEFKTRLSLSALLFPILYAKGLKDIAKALTKIKDMNNDQVMRGLVGLLGSLVIMAAIAVKLSELQTRVSLSALLFPVVYAKALKTIANSLVAIKDFTGDQVMRGMVALLGSLVVMAAIAVKLSDFKTRLNLTALLFPVVYAKALKTISDALVPLKDFTGDQIMQGMVALLGSLLVMAAIAVKIGELGTILTISALLFPLLYSKGLVKIAEALNMLRDYDYGQMIVALIVLLGALGIMAVIGNELSKLQNKISIGALVFPILYAAGLKSIAKALLVLKDFTGDQIMRGMVALLGSLVVMAAIAVRLSELQTKVSLSALVFPVFYANSLKAIARSLVMLKDLDNDQVMRGMVALLGSLVVMAAIAVKLSELATTISVSALALPIAYAVGLLLFAIAIRAVGTMAEGDLIQGLLAMVGALVLFGVIVGGLSALEMPLKSIADTLLHFAASAVVIAVGFAIMSVGFLALAAAISMFKGVEPEQLATALIALAVAMAIFVVAANAISPLSVGLIFLGTGFLILSLGIYVLIEALINLNDNFDKIAEGASQFGGVLLSVIGGIFTALFNTIMANAPKFLAAGLFLIVAFAGGFLSGPVLLIPILAFLIVKIIEFIISHIDAIKAAGVNFILGFMEGIASLFVPILEAIDGFVGGIVGKICSLLGIESPSKVMEWVGQMMDEGLSTGIEGNADGVTNSAANLATDAKSSFMDEFLKNNDLLNTGEEGAGQVAEGLENGIPGVEGITGDMMDAANFNIEDYINGGAFEENGEAVDMSFITGMDNLSGDVSNSALTIAQDACDEAGSTRSDWVDVGESLGNGLAEGIRDSGSYVSSVARQIVEEANAAAREAAQVNSPSKVWMRLGNSLDEGLIMGMMAMGSQVNSTATGVMNNVIDAAKRPIDMLADLMSSEIIDSPVITPVFDLSEIQNGANRLYSMLPDSERLSLNGNIDLANDTSLSVSRDQQRKRESDNQMMGSLIDAINGLSALIGNTGNVYNVNGVTYDDGSNVSTAVRSLLRAAKIEGRA